MPFSRGVTRAYDRPTKFRPQHGGVGAETVDPATLARYAEAFAPCGFRVASFYWLMIVRGLNHHPQDIEATARNSQPLFAPGLGAALAFQDHGAQCIVLVHEVGRDGTADRAPVIDAVHGAVDAIAEKLAKL